MIWSPCEALVRIACRETHRLALRLSNDYDYSMLPNEEKVVWSELILNFFADLISESVILEETYRVGLLNLRFGNIGNTMKEEPSNIIQDVVPVENSIVQTPYGRGTKLNRKLVNVEDEGDGKTHFFMEEIALDFGAKLFRPEFVAISPPKIDTVAVPEPNGT